MNKLQEFMPAVSGLKDFIQRLEILSGPGRFLLGNLKFMKSDVEIGVALDDVEVVLEKIGNSDFSDIFDHLKLKLMQVRDINGTIGNLSSGNVLDDIELFEIKKFGMLAEDIRQLIESLEIDFVVLPDFSELVSILDPGNTKVAYFHVYDAYSEKLASLRRALKIERKGLEKTLPGNCGCEGESIEYKGGDVEKADELYAEAMEEEDRIRIQLSESLRKYSDSLGDALNTIGYLDFTIAKAVLASKLDLRRPQLKRSGKMIYKSLWHPQVKDMLEKRGKSYQRITVEVCEGVTIVTGANMAGKSLILKTVALLQVLTQLGFYLPVEYAEVVPVEDVMISIGDDQSEESGLSSFGAEMLRINEMIQAACRGVRMLALIDEPARTTNPTEGKALVKAMTQLLNIDTLYGIVTTHYSGINTGKRHLRVKGFIDRHPDMQLTPGKINDYIDYQLIEDQGDEVPMEALQIARLLGVEDKFVELAGSYLKD